MMKEMRMNIKDGEIICLPLDQSKCEECPNYHGCEEYAIYIDTEKDTYGFKVVRYTKDMIKDMKECGKNEDCDSDCSSCG